MVTIAGENIPINLHINGFMANTWIWIFIVAIIGIIIVIGVALLLYYKTYKRRVLVWDPNGWKVVFKSRARVIRLGPERTELMKTFSGNYYVSAYDKKTNNAYWYVIGSDGYWYNVSLGDWDAKMGMIDIEPIDRDVRAQHKANADLVRLRYGEKKNLEKWLFGIFLLALMVIFFVGMYVTWGRVADAVSPLADSNKIAVQNQQTNAETAEKLSLIAERLGVISTQQTGTVPAPPANSTG
jgi:hypothetical protein